MNVVDCIGKIAKDTVTGYSGKVTGVAVYLTGSDRILIESIDTTNRPVDYWFDADRVVFYEEI